ncbi:MAG: hypothetical protein EBR82_30055 [Caulobacteraceae bacterium]|nr:hypothetical protein [Caulobacteraceae bacterium]
MPITSMTPLPGMTYSDYVSVDTPYMDISESMVEQGLAIGDLVTYRGMTYSNGLSIYRIVKDCPPRLDAVWGEVGRVHAMWHKNRRTQMGWVRPGTRTPVPHVRLRGCVEIVPVHNFIDAEYQRKRRSVSYDRLWKLEKVDVLTLGEAFVRYQDFLKSEIKRIQEG